MDEYLWPARHVAEHAYCPRLFYFMEVEGIDVANADTEAGNLVHRRVHHAGAAPEQFAADPDAPRKVRGLALTSPSLRLTATLDLAEIEGQVVVPVEYRRGRPRETTPPHAPDQMPQTFEPWPTDRVQIGLQVLLLEEAGYRVDRAVVYYAATKQRITVEANEQLRSDALTTLRAAQDCAGGSRPPPLVNDPRCARCSLQPVCLPDEVNLERNSGGEPRLLWPPSDEGIHLVAQQDGTKIGLKGLALKVSDYEGNVTREIPLAQVESLAIVGAVQLTTQALTALADRCVPVGFMSGAGRLLAVVDPLDSVSAQIRLAQVRVLDQPPRALELAKALVAAKIVNQRVMLLRNGDGVPAGTMDELSHQAEQARNCDNLESLRGHEGQAAAVYFEHFSKMIRSDVAAEFDRNGRMRRPPPDPVNATLSMAYTMLTHECVSALRLARLEPAIGALHTCRPGRPALALDLMEPFRPLIADSVAISGFSRDELSQGHFLKTAAGCALTDAGRKSFFGIWGRRMETEVTHPVFGYRLCYRRMLMLHARMISAWLVGDVPSLSFLTTR